MLHDTADFTLDTDAAEADVTVTVAGEIDLDTAGRFRDAALSALTAAPKTLRLDLAGVSFMDSTGLHALMATKRRADLAGVQLVLTRPSPTVARLLDLSGLDRVFERDG